MSLSFTTERPRLLLVGNGMTGERLLDELLTRGALERFSVTVVGEERHAAYNRILLTSVLAGAAAESIVTKPHDWYRRHDIELLSDRRVRYLDTDGRLAHLSDGRVVAYDVAVLATGSEAVRPPIAGIGHRGEPPVPGVHVFRNLDDCLRLRAATTDTSVADAVVVGGGLLGLEAAKALLDHGKRVTLVHATDALLNAQLDDVGGRFLRRSVEALGITVVTGRAASLLARATPDALALEDGRVVPAQLVVLATGVRPRIEVADASGISTNRAILVDDQLATSAPGVYAIGDCAEHASTTFGLVAPGWEHAGVVADLLAGTRPDARYAGSTPYTRLKVAGIDVVSMGVTDAGPDDEVVQVIEERRGVYRKLIAREGRLVGACAVGDAAAGASLLQLLERRDPLPANAIDVLCSPNAFAGPGLVPSEVCTCNHVTEPTLLAAIDSGCSSLDELRACTRAGTGCGSCVGQLRRLLDAHGAPRPAAVPA
jgi:nitrite reductase (NADH) large subunit